MINSRIRILAIAAFVLMAVPAHAQLGSLVGKVIGKDGKPVGDATVTIERPEVKYRVELKTDRGGNYSRLGLEDGSYRVTLSQQGTVLAVRDVVVSLGARTEKNFDLRNAAEPAAAAVPLSRAQREAEQRANGETQGAFNAGVVALNAGNGDEALKQFLLGAERKPSAAVYNRLGETYMFLKKYSEAVEAFQKATEMKADEADYFDRLGGAAVQASRFDVANASIRKAVALDPARGATAFLNLGKVLAEKNQDTSAVEALQLSIKANPKAADPYYELGMLYMKNMSTMKDAAAQFEKYIQTAPKNDPKAATARQLADAALAAGK